MVAVLALGYNGGVNSLRAMGAVGEDGQLKTLVTAWRRTNAKIVELWERLDDAFYSGGDLGLVRVEREGSRRSLVLPSGRALHYHDTKFKLDSLGRRRPSFLTPQGYTRTPTAGGSPRTSPKPSPGTSSRRPSCGSTAPGSASWATSTTRFWWRATTWTASKP